MSIWDTLRKENKDKFESVNLPNLKSKRKIMILDIKTPVKNTQLVDFHYMSKQTSISKNSAHGLYTAEVIKQVAGEELELYLANYDDESNVIDYCIANDIKIINASCYYPKTEEREAQLKRFYERGGVFVACAGNFEGKDVKYPGNSKYTLCVSATNDPDCDGQEIDITFPSLLAVYTSSMGLHYFDGTSCATPFATGCIVHILDKFPNWNLDKVKEFMQKNSVEGNEEYEKVFSFPKNFLELEDNNMLFPDTKDSWAKKEIDIITNKGLMKGFDDNLFHPKEPITREQMAVILYRLFVENKN